MKRFYHFAFFLLLSVAALAQPANDNCATAQAIGTLPTPAACPSGAGTNVTVTGTLNGATAANPYVYQGTGCTGSSTTMGAPANDVWYTFVASGYQLNLTLNGTVVNPNVALYSGTCGALGGGIGGCAVGTAGGAATLTVSQMVPGTTYYLQVSGNTAGATGTFTMNINNSIDCNNCLGATNLTVTPPPTNGMYQPGTTVNFCFKVNSYTQVNTNWLHGVQLSFGSGWNLGSLTTTSPPPCQGTGYWQYYPAGITDNSGQAWPAGFYFETITGQNQPGNNFGDNCSGTISAANWNFCWTITTAAACNPGSNLSVVVNTSGDGESGSWTNLGCSGDPPINFSAIGACCPPTATATPVSCNGAANGTATVSPIGTQSPFTYSWSPSGGTGSTASGLGPGTYTVVVTDKNNCAASTTVSVTQPTAVTITLTPTNPSCGSNNGSITAGAGGGTPAYQYQINGGGYGAGTTFGSLGAGTYTVDVKDSKGCVKTATVTLNTTGTTTITANPATICTGASTTLTATGASSYTWSANAGSATTASVSVSPGATTVYTVTGNNGGCVGTNTVQVTVNPLPTINVNSGTTCNGGSVTLTASGANTYTWSPGTGLSGTSGASVTASPVSTTVYTVSGTNASGCISSNTATVTVVGNPTVTVNSATICIGQQTATLTANGATTYSWTPGTGLSGTSGTTVTGAPAATTVYTVTGTAGTCTAVATTTITVNPLPTVTANSATICLGQQTATLTANGASTYTWNPATGLSSSTGATVTGTPGATTPYTVTGTDANGCTNTGTATITVNPTPTVIVTNGLICTGSSITLTAAGAATYSWIPGTGLSATTGSNVTASPTTTTHYTVVGVDANGCVGGDTTSVTVVSNPTVTVTSSTICLGQQTATLTANGASTYTWTPGTGLSTTTGATVTGTPATTTAYTITGTVGTCTATGTATITVNPLPTVTASSGTICVGQQTATLTANGASTYTWSPGTGLSGTTGATVTGTPGSTTPYTVTGTDANGCTSTGTATITVNPLPNVTVNSGLICSGSTLALTANGASTYSWSPGTGLSGTSGTSVNANPASTTVYTVVGTDANGCFSPATSTVTVASNPTITVSTGTICLGQGTATLTANGATSYTWTPATGLSSTNGASVSANPNATTTYTITGSIGTCTAVGTTTVTVNPLPAITANSNSPICVNGTLNLTGGGGINYAWNGPNSFQSMLQNPSISGVTALATGVYSVVGVDANGCVNTDTVNVLINPLPVVTATGATVCVGQTFTLNCTPNGAPGYSWSGPLAFNSNIQNPSVANANPSMAGPYVVTVTDGNGCVNANVAQVVVNALPLVTANSDTICAGQTTATLNANGANTYGWSPSTGLSSSSGASIIANPGSTTVYTVTGTDINGCQNTATLSVVVNPAPLVSIAPQNTSGCAPLCVAFTNSTSTTGSTCSWNFGDGGTDVNCASNHCFTTAGAYTATLTVTDNNGCVASGVSTVNVYPVPKADFNVSPQPTTILEPTIQFYDATTGAVINSWSWNFGDNGSTSNTAVTQNPQHVYGDTGTYMAMLTVVSDHGCRDSVIKLIKIDDDFALYVPNAFSPNSDGVNDIFGAKGFGYKIVKLYIFDRWGEQLFFSDDINKGWDGSFQGHGTDIVQEDVYVWKIEATTVKGDKRQMSGTVSLLK